PDGVQQISAILAGYEHLDAVDIISHGADGAVKLGDRWLTEDQLPGAAGDLKAWGQALSFDGDILIYGCDVAGTSAGKQLLKGLSDWTGADVAASTDETGSARFGGNWNLEFTIGSVETPALLSPQAQQNWDGLLQ